MGFFSGAGKGGNESGGNVNGKHRGKVVKTKGGVNKPAKGKHAKAEGHARQNNSGWGGGGAGAGLDRWG